MVGTPLSGERGAIAEDIAADFLRLQGYTIVARNYRCRRGEIDIIAKRDHVLVFVEVKMRQADTEGSSAMEAVGPKKQKSIVKAALQFAASQYGSGVTLRFDVIGVTWDEREHSLEVVHLKHAFEPDARYYY
jgi:putative endonuclease